ncbi:hypothetical protein E4U43_004443 [Claviceps pusilla]|uniref:Uncharacterized protein n=1 Tax=Claviceps pusilla TaxID=123648 RepID=A0A9P7SWW4_9HYPO|nr:hypothetical protein E4U43_004443 [Claviceps pusilla]
MARDGPYTSTYLPSNITVNDIKDIHPHQHQSIAPAKQDIVAKPAVPTPLPLMIFMTKEGAHGQADRRQRYSMEDIELCCESRVDRHRTAEYGRACVAARPDRPVAERTDLNGAEDGSEVHGGGKADNRKGNVSLLKD